MGFMQKILDVFNMDNWNNSPNMIQEKEPKPDNLFWDEEPTDENSKNTENVKREKREKSEPYEYVLFSTSIDMSAIIGSRNDYMRRDYTTDPRYGEYYRYIHKLWKNSVELEKIVKAKKFFEVLEEFEKSINIINRYKFEKFLPELEKSYYYSKKDEIMISFLDRCFTDEYRNALELKTLKGRIGRIDHWFLMMDYYKYYLTPNALAVLDALYKKWTGELMPNLLECKS